MEEKIDSFTKHCFMAVVVALVGIVLMLFLMCISIIDTIDETDTSKNHISMDTMELHYDADDLLICIDEDTNTIGLYYANTNIGYLDVSDKELEIFKKSYLIENHTGKIPFVIYGGKND